MLWCHLWPLWPNAIYVNGYAEDHALDKTFDARSHEDEHETIGRLENCISAH